MGNGHPMGAVITTKEIANALNNAIEAIEAAIMNALFTTPPALSADIYNTGLYLTGGGGMLRGLDKRISQKTKLPVYVAEDPLRAVARGTGIALKNIEKFPFLIKLLFVRFDIKIIYYLSINLININNYEFPAANQAIIEALVG